MRTPKLMVVLIVTLALFMATSCFSRTTTPQDSVSPGALALDSEHWAAQYASEIAKWGGLRRDDLDASLTREEFAVMLATAMGYPLAAPSTASFVDVPKTAPGFAAVEALVKQGVVKVPDDKAFGPERSILRWEMAQWSLAARGLLGDSDRITEINVPATDEDEVPPSAVGIVTMAYAPNVQLLTFRPARRIAASDPATVGEGAYAAYLAKNPPARGGTATRPRQVEPAELNSVLTTTGGTSTFMSYASDTLVGRALDEQGEVVYYPIQLRVIPSLENGLIRLLPEGKMEVTFEFRKTLKWHDGVEATAEDAVFMWQVMTDPGFPAVSREGFNYIESLTVKDKHSVVAVYKQLYPHAWVGSARYQTFFLLPKHVFGQDYETARQSGSYDVLAAKMAQTPVYTGPFYFQEFVPGQHLILRANEHYFLGRPNLDKIVVKTIRDTSVKTTFVTTGEADFDAIYSPEEGVVVEQRLPPSMAIHWFTRQDDFLPVFFNHRDPEDLSKPHPILGDVRVRKALAHATNRELIAEVAYGGKVTLADHYIGNPRLPMFHATGWYQFDLDRARELLEEAGWKVGADGIREKGGIRLSLTIVSPAGNVGYEMSQELMQNTWRQAGVELRINNMPWATFTSQFRKYGKFDLAFAGWNTTEFTEGIERFHSSQIPTEGNKWAGLNYWGWSNPENDRILEEAASSIDQDVRRTLYQRHLEIYREDVASLPMFFRMNAFVHKADLVIPPDQGMFEPGEVNSIYRWYWRR